MFVQLNGLQMDVLRDRGVFDRTVVSYAQFQSPPSGGGVVRVDVYFHDGDMEMLAVGPMGQIHTLKSKLEDPALSNWRPLKERGS